MWGQVKTYENKRTKSVHGFNQLLDKEEIAKPSGKANCVSRPYITRPSLPSGLAVWEQ